MPATRTRPAARTRRLPRGRSLLPAIVVVIVIAGLLLSMIPAPAAQAADRKDAGARSFAPGRVIVGFRPSAGQLARTQAISAVGATSSRSLTGPEGDVVLVRLPATVGVRAAIRRLEALPGVRYAEPDWHVEAAATPNDPYVTNGQLWGMYGGGTTPANQYGSGALSSWDAGSTGSRSVVVGIIDEGVDITHPDLAANIWTNPYDPVDGQDNDGNGYIDDTNGWDFFYNDRTVKDAGEDSHGTHVAGTIGGVGNNGIGVAGVNWEVTMISTKFLGPGGGSTSGAVSALAYLTDLKTRHGINIVATNNSWGGGGFSQALLDAIEAAGDAGILFIAAAGNSTSNNDSVQNYPSNYQCTQTAAGAARGWDCVIAVASITSTGGISSFSSYGATTVDLGAPGSDIWSSLPGNTYGSYSGTSMATPHVTGAAALCASVAPGITPSQLRGAVTSGTVALNSLAGKTVSGGRLDVPSVLTACSPPTAPVTGSPSGLTATGISSTRIDLAWTDGASNESSYEVERAPDTGTCGTWSRVAVLGPNSTAWRMTVASGQGGDFCFRVRATNGYQGGTVSSWSNVAKAGTLPPPAPYTCQSTTYDWLDATAGTQHALTDDSGVGVSLPFTFRLYGEPTQSVTVSSNGFLTVGGGAATYVNTAIPDPSDPSGMAAAWWDDLNPGTGGQVWTRTIGSSGSRRFVATWLNVPIFGQSATDGVTFQIVLEETTNAIVLAWQDVSIANAAYDGGASATIGVESPDGTAGTQISLNSATRTAGTAVRCADTSATLPSVTTNRLAAGTIGASYQVDLAASGGQSPYTWALVQGTLPDGLSLANGGRISGTPTTAGSASLRFRVTDANNATATKDLTLDVATAVSVTTTSLPNAPAGAAYSQALAATGGTGTYTWDISAGSLPTGLTLDAATGTISGTPSGSGIASFTVRATDDSNPGRAGTADLTIEVLAAPTITTAGLPEGVTGTAYSATLVASGGTGPYTFAVKTGTLPDGITLTAATGALGGTPTTAGDVQITWSATDANGAVGTATLTLPIVAPLSVTTATLPRGVVGRDYSEQLASSGGRAPITWTVVSGLPAGLSLSGAGVLSGQPTSAGTGDLVVRATDAASRTSDATISFSVVTAPAIDTATLPDATKGNAYSATLTASSGTGPYTWTLVDGQGALPSGLSLSSAGEISGTTAGTGGVKTFTVRVEDANSVKTTKQLSILVIVPFSANAGTVPEGTIRVSYTYTPSVVGGTSPYTWSVASGSLPAGLTLTASSGRISGTPTVAGLFPVTLRVREAGNATADLPLSLRIRPGAFTLRSPSNGARTTSTSILLDWNDSRAATGYRWCMDTTSGTTCDTSWQLIVGSGSTAPVSQVTVSGLVSGQTYYWTVVAISGDPLAADPILQATSTGWRSFSRR